MQLRENECDLERPKTSKFAVIFPVSAVLRDYGGDSFGVRQCEAESHWSAVVEHVDGEAVEAYRLRETANELGQGSATRFCAGRLIYGPRLFWAWLAAAVWDRRFTTTCNSVFILV